MFDRDAFVRPIAHRGLHDTAWGIVENSAGAFEAAIVRGFGIECDLQPSADGVPMVFHDEALSRLVDCPGRTTDHDAASLRRLTYRISGEPLLELGDLLDLVRGQVPLLVEIKSAWTAPDPKFMTAIAARLSSYRGPAAIMSFDPAIVTALRPLLPDVPRGIVSGIYKQGWLPEPFDEDLAWRLTNLVESRAAAPDFFAYHVKDLPTPVTRFLREGLGIPLFAWTVRSAEDLASSRQWADAPIFETIDPGA